MCECYTHNVRQEIIEIVTTFDLRRDKRFQIEKENKSGVQIRHERYMLIYSVACW